MFERTAFVKFTIRIALNKTKMKHNKNHQKSMGKSIPENLKKRLLPNVCDFQKETHSLWDGFKNL
jgi:hypothetical protein